MVVLTKSLPHSQPNSDCSMATAQPPPGRWKTRGFMPLEPRNRSDEWFALFTARLARHSQFANAKLTLVSGPHPFVLQFLRCAYWFARSVRFPGVPRLGGELARNYGLYNGFKLCEARAIPGTEAYLD